MDNSYKEKIDTLTAASQEWNVKKQKYRDKAKHAEEQEKKCLTEIERLKKELIIQDHQEMEDLARSLGGADAETLRIIIKTHPEIQDLISDLIKERNADETVIPKTE